MRSRSVRSNSSRSAASPDGAVASEASATPRTADDLGAHVSAAGGVNNAPSRAAELDAVVLQLFTKQPSRWAEPSWTDALVRAWADARQQHGIRRAAAHDSYLINLATPDPVLLERSRAAFRQELHRCEVLGLDYLVTHPGNATDGNRQRGIGQNADAVAEALSDSPGHTMVLFETTAGSGSALGASFEELAALIERIPRSLRHRVGVCLDTCHVHAAGYDIVRDYRGVMDHFDAVVGVQRIRLFHLNDSATPFASRRDRHAHIGEGSLGDEPFRRLLVDERFRDAPKVLETPKDGDPSVADRRNLDRLRSLRREADASREQSS